MKSHVCDKSAGQEIPFPKLMIGETTGVIVLFQRPNEGIIVRSAWNPIGEKYTTFHMKGFKDFVGTVTLSNDNIC